MVFPEIFIRIRILTLRSPACLCTLVTYVCACVCKSVHTHVQPHTQIHIQILISVNMHVKHVSCAGGVWCIVCACTQLNIFQYMNETEVHVRQEGTGEKGRERCKIFQTKGKAVWYKKFGNCWY